MCSSSEQSLRDDLWPAAEPALLETESVSNTKPVGW